MKPNETPVIGDADRFRTTYWSVVSLSAQSLVPGSRPALADPRPALADPCRPGP
jgi:hypothetical protein